MKKYKFLSILLVFAILLVVPVVHAHDVDIDPDNVIQMPGFSTVSGISGSTKFGLPIEVDDSFGNYKMYYQFVKMDDTVYSEYLSLIEDQKATNDESEKEEYEASIKSIKPEYDESAWEETNDNKAYFDISDSTIEVGEEEAYVLWVMVTTTDESETIYDEKVIIYENKEVADEGQGSTADTPTDESNEESPETSDSIMIVGVIAVAAMGVMVLSYKKSRA